MADNAGPAPNEIQRAATGAFTVSMVPANIRLYTVTEHQLENIGTFGLVTSIFLAMFGITLGCFVAFFIVVRTVAELKQYDQGQFVALEWVAGVLTVFCGAMFGLGLTRYVMRLNQVKENPTVQQLL